MDFSLSEDQQAIGDLAAKILAEKAQPRAAARAREARRPALRPRALARASPTRVCSASRCPRSTAAPGSASSRWRRSSSRSAGAPRRSRCSRRSCSRRCRSPSSAARRSAPRGCRSSRAARRSARPRSSRMRRARAARDGDGFRLSGKKLCVPAAEFADVVLVPADVDGQRDVLPRRSEGAPACSSTRWRRRAACPSRC